MVAPIAIGKKLIGPGQPCFLIAEVGVNHNGDLNLARQMIEAAATAGADAVKFQTFKAERLVTSDAPKAFYQLKATSQDETQFEMLRSLELSREQHETLINASSSVSIEFLSSPFDEESADLLEDLGLAAFKIPSGEITNLPFLRYVAGKGLPLIVSTGMADLEEVSEAVYAIRETSDCPLVLLHCVSSYPAAPSETNLRAMLTMQKEFDVPVGFSDHSQGKAIAIAAAALGACVVEKHFTLDRQLPGPDQSASLEPSEFGEMTASIRTVERALGDGVKKRTDSEIDTARAARKSLVAAVDIPAGSTLKRKHIVIMRPGTGIPPSLLDDVIGKVAVGFIRAGTLLSPDLLR